ncbi:hypothetical protein EP331_04565 [bacterium]|nr:MAG: hypothetical protein EP331_04565 [bacterium]
MKSIILSGLLALGFLSIHTDVQAQEIKLKGKELFGDINARQIGPAIMSGRISEIEVHPTNNRIIYIGAAGGGVWKSGNGGMSFTSIFDEQPQSIGAIALDPSNPDKNVWVGTGEVWVRNSVSAGAGIYLSTDGGTTWNYMGLKETERIAGIEINPKNSDEIYVAAMGALWGDSNERGVYKSSDAGKTWEKILFVNNTTGCSDLIMDPNDPNTLYAAMWEFRRTAWSFSSGGINSALYKTTDGGKTWNKIHNGFPKGKLGRIAITVAPSNSSVLYSVLETEKDDDKGLYRSDDAGKNWKKLNGDFGLVVRPFYFSRIVVDPKNPDVVVKAGLFGSISRDGGKTFKNLGAMHSDIHDIAFDINDSDRIYVATDGGLYRTYDGGNTMEIVENLPVSQFYHVTVDNKTPYNIYGGLQDNGSWYGPSRSPGGIEARDWMSVGAGDGFRVYKHSTKEVLYSEMQGAENIWRYDINRNQTKTIQPLAVKGEDELRFNWNAPIATSLHKPDRIFVGSQFLHMSDDMGDTWVKISPDLTTNDKKKQNQEDSGGLSKDNSGAEKHCTIFTIAESPLDENVIWVGTDDGNIQLTLDGGKTWTNTVKNITGVPANTWVYHIEASVHAKGTAYAVFDGHTANDMKAYVYKTTDFGKTWTSITTDDIEGFSRTLQEDYVNPNLLFLGTEMGLYVTIDGGQNWSKFTNNVPSVAVLHLEMHKGTNDLILATHGRGVIVLDDISPLREITPDVVEKDVHFFASKPTLIVEESGFASTSTELQFVGPNPSRDVRIIYYLKKRHTFGKMSMEIQDMEGNTLIELVPGKSKGINVVTWNGSTKQPKMAKGKTFTFGGFTSPRVQAGTYKVVMTKGKATYETTIELVNDPTSVITEKERIAQHETTMKLFNMSQDLAYLVYELDEYVTKADELINTDKKAKKIAEPVSKKLNTLKETLVITTGDNYVGTAKNQLREDISELYSKIASGFEAPSSSELENLSLLTERYEKAVKEFEKLKNKEVKKLEKYITEKGGAAITLKTYEAFIKD